MTISQESIDKLDYRYQQLVSNNKSTDNKYGEIYPTHRKDRAFGIIMGTIDKES